ncbi:hypothetical protein TorRG33x02_061240, partial [Trema orientale]
TLSIWDMPKTHHFLESSQLILHRSLPTEEVDYIAPIMKPGIHSLLVPNHET